MSHCSFQSNCLIGKHFSITGRLSLMTRSKAAELICSRGASFQNTVTAKTDYLVVGDNSYHRTFIDGVSRKLFYAYKLQNVGHPIEIISEEDFILLLWQG